MTKLALSSLIAIAAVTAGVRPAAMPRHKTHEQTLAAAESMRQNMRKLWTDHVVWTRAYVVAAVAGQPDAQAAAARLMKNQEDIGAAIATIYGRAAGDRLTVLLKDHIAVAVDIVAAAKAGNHSAQQQAEAKWQKNAEDIADFLARANPHWPRATLLAMMTEHLSTTRDEVVARLTKNWEADVRAYDRVYDHILAMADALADGIIRQFPERFAPK